MKTKHLFLLDGSNYIFRAYYAFPKLKRKKDDLTIGAVFGFCSMLWKILLDIKHNKFDLFATHFAVIFDYPFETFRKKNYPLYKKNRKKTPLDLVHQFDLIHKATKAFNLPCIQKKGFEADDIIATFCKKSIEKGIYVTIITSDKDFMQLVNEWVCIYDSKNNKKIGIQDVFEKWGVYPEKMADLQALVGDSIDNIPGVLGIGPKTAAKLIKKYGDLQTIINNANEIPHKKCRDNIINYQEQAKFAFHLVKLCSNVPLEISIDDLIFRPFNTSKLIKFLKDMELENFVRRVNKENR